MGLQYEPEKLCKQLTGFTSGVVCLRGQPLSKESLHGQTEVWDARQALFDTKAWHAVRGWAPNSTKCIAISTKASIKEMILPGVYAICVPLLVGFLVGSRMLMGVLAGSVGSGAMLAIMMSNAGGAWDNSNKYIEIAGAHGGKGTDIHKACVVGDTVGDPFKDTSGPALNILLKLMAVVSLVIATLLKGRDDWALGMWSPLPGVIIVGATVYYCKVIYGENDKKHATPPATPYKKQRWHSGASTDVSLKETVTSAVPAREPEPAPAEESEEQVPEPAPAEESEEQVPEPAPAEEFAGESLLAVASRILSPVDVEKPVQEPDHFGI